MVIENATGAAGKLTLQLIKIRKIRQLEPWLRHVLSHPGSFTYPFLIANSLKS